jgi:hypothetical protein
MNIVDAAHYAGWDGYLASCENDAQVMRTIAAGAGFATQSLLSQQATRQAVITAISSAAAQLTAGDCLIVSYAGHGGQLRDLNGDEADRFDETWCLYDGELLDDELFALWRKFAAGVRIILISDSCHSGTILWTALANKSAAAYEDDAATVARLMPARVAAATYAQNKIFYDELQRPDNRDGITAGLVSITACTDDQLSRGTDVNGLFTSAFDAAWREGAGQQGYAALVQRIHQRIEPAYQGLQIPQLNQIGSVAPSFINGPVFAA